MTPEDRDPRVRELVFELIDAAPAPPPFPEAGVAVTGRVATRARRPRSWAVALLAALLVAGSVAAVVIARRSPAQHPLGPAAAPSVAFVDGRGLVVRAPSGAETVVTRGPVVTPKWSPSGEWLAYEDSGSVFVVRSDGRHPISLGDFGTFEWSPVVDALATTDKAGVRVWSMHDTAPQSVGIEPQVGGVDSEALSVVWSADGTSLAMAMERRDHTGPGAPVDSLWLATDVCRPSAPVECGAPRKLTHIPYTPGPEDYPLLVTAFGFDDTQVLFWADYIGSSSIEMDGLPLRAVSVDGGKAAGIATTIVRDSWVGPSPDGSKLLVVRSNGRMVTDLRQLEVCTAPDACRKIAAAPDVQTLDPAWSPDGKQIAFVRETNASYTPPLVDNGIDWRTKYRNRTLWIANADGSDPHEVTAAGRGVADPQFAPDGRSIVFVRDARVWQLDLATGHIEPLTGSLRTAPTCTFDDCLPDVAPYEGINLWSTHYAVKFAEPSH